MVEFKRVSFISVLAIIVLIVMLKTLAVKTTYQDQAPKYPLHLEHSNSQGTVTDSTKTLKGKKTEGEHISGKSVKHQLTQRDIDGVRYFVLFIGYGRSGHSIIGSMMDAHPNMVIAHEYCVIDKWSKDRKRLSDKKTLFNELCSESRSNTAPDGMYNRENKGYTLAIPNLWQGCRFTDLKVIGDKRGGSFADLATLNFEETWQVFNEVRETVGVPIKLIHVIRNPFDIIATTCFSSVRVGQHRWENDSHTVKTETISTKAISSMKKKAEAIIAVKKKWGADMLEIHHADFVHDPKAVLQRICDFVEVGCPKEYLETCYNKTFKTVSKSRYLVNWPSDAIAEGEEMMKEIPFFRRYSFDSED